MLNDLVYYLNNLQIGHYLLQSQRNASQVPFALTLASTCPHLLPKKPLKEVLFLTQQNEGD